LTKAELILYFMAEMPDMVGQAPTTVLNLAKFAISAVDSSTPGDNPTELHFYSFWH
jgi:hypothetical protein